MADLKEYTEQEVAAHRGSGDIWMTIHNKVYNVSSYLKDHPGGPEVLVESAGIDASEAFDNAGHSEDAFELMDAYCVGTLKASGRKAAPKPVRLMSTPPAAVAGSTTSRFSTHLATFALFSLSTVVASFALRRAAPNLHLPLSRFAVSLPWSSTRGRGFGFTEGMLVGAGILALFNGVFAHRIMGLIRGSGSKSFTAYRPHLKMPKRAEVDLLARRGWLDPVTYYPLPLAKKELVSPNVYRFTFSLPSPQTIVGLPTGQHVAIKAEIDGETVVRSYTPVSNNADKGIVELVIKVYPDGSLTSKYLAKLNVGDEVLFRGPKGAMRYTRGCCKKIGMLAGGTGITPMFQLIRAICESDRDTTEISLIYANRSEEDILLRAELDGYARRYPKNFKVYYLLDKAPEGWQYGQGYVTKELMAERFPGPEMDTKIMLCGPPGMVNAAKTSLGALGYQAPGAMSKMTDQVFLF